MKYYFCKQYKNRNNMQGCIPFNYTQVHNLCTTIYHNHFFLKTILHFYLQDIFYIIYSLHLRCVNRDVGKVFFFFHKKRKSILNWQIYTPLFCKPNYTSCGLLRLYIYFFKDFIGIKSREQNMPKV